MAGALQALVDVDHRARVGVGPGRVVKGHRRLAGRGVHRHLAERDLQAGEQGPRLVDLARAGNLAGGDGGDLLGLDVHSAGSALMETRAPKAVWRTTGPRSLPSPA